jgi:pimeloyl-ACP methyl ester carboxylesterase
MGADCTPFAADPFAQWIDAIVARIEAADGPVILVGHSQGGPVISQAAERAADKVAGLVYVTALLRRDGETVLGGAPDAAASDLPVDIHYDVNGLVMLPEAMARVAFYGMCSEADIAAALARLTPQPPGVSFAVLSLSEERFGRIAKFYVETRHDMAIPLDKQREMQGNWPCTLLATLDTDHSPFYTAPAELAAALLKVA